MKKYLILIGTVCCMLMLSGCVETFNYTGNLKKIVPAPYNSVVVVKNFIDERPIVLNDNLVWTGCIPLMPFGWGDFAHPEDGSYLIGTSSFDFKPTIDLAQAAETSLKKSGMFKHVYYADKYTDFKNADYIFTGIIYSTNYGEKVLTYGTSIASPVLWAIGLPDGVTNNELKIRFLVKDAKTDKILWSYLVDERDSGVQWIYWNDSFKGYPSMMHNAMKKALNNLNQFISSYEDNLSMMN
ncbi:MAG TPA: hypothetical protein QF753_02075 [Victivallales bacterium]|nr:hypothetical protein [Victivallales bacterium]